MPDPIQTQFEKYHAANPALYAKICEYAREAKRRGYEKIGIKMLVEIIRRMEFVPGPRHKGYKRLHFTLCPPHHGTRAGPPGLLHNTTA